MSATITIEQHYGAGTPQWTCTFSDPGGVRLLTVTGHIDAVLAALQVSLAKWQP